MSKRTYGASMVLARLLNGERLTEAQITFLTNGEQQSRVMNELSRSFIPWECDQSEAETKWYMSAHEIERYHNCREEQIADERSHYYAKQTIRLDKALRKAIQWRGVTWLLNRVGELAANDPVYDPGKEKEPKQ